MRACVVAILMWLFAMTGAAFATDATVLEGEAARSGLKTGSIFSSRDSIHLDEGEHLVIYLQRGEMLTLEGPHDGPLPVDGAGGGDPDEVSMVSILVGHRGTTSTVGAFEATPATGAPAEPEARPNAWAVDVAEAGTSCIDGELRLFRADATREEHVTARNPLVAPVALDWPAGAHTLAVPEGLLSAGYVNIDRGERTLRFTVRRLPDDRDVSEPGKLLRWFAEMGCESQASVLIGRMVAE
ncbi:hypothetical protein [Acuticoccus sediminis]|nr:hypothetical protein [Acuticoccus sediminis]